MQCLPSDMSFFEVLDPGTDGRIHMRRGPLPSPCPDQVLIRVSYIGVNRADLLQTQGLYPAPKDAASIPGLEVSGTIVMAGKAVHGWKVGDQAAALLAGGGYAEYALAHQGHLLPINPQMGLRGSAALPEALCTIEATLFEEAKLKEGETLLIHGGASGIGTTGIQLARAAGARVFATAGSAEKCALCEKLGATAIPYREVDFVEQILAATEGRGVNVILDSVGGDYIQRNFKALATGGRLITIAFLRGNSITLNLAPLLMKRLRWTGSALRSRPDDEKAYLLAKAKARTWPLIEENRFFPVIDSEFSFENAEKALFYMEQNLNLGKILLKVSG